MLAKIKTLFLDIRVLLACILLLGFVFRIWGLGSAEIFHDEGLYAFRSIGYMDFIQNNDQTTPIQWFKDLPTMPWWTKLSFHDHPPLYFLTQHIFFKAFGDSLFVARLPSLIAGMFAIWIVFLIGRRLFKNDFSGLLAALCLSINHIHIWISRTSIMESLLLTLMLANIYFFLRFVENKKWWFLFAFTLGLSFLTKYNSIVLVPLYAIYLIVFYRSYFRAKELYFSVGAVVIMFSPVLIYNYYLYQTVHHFDLQIAYFFKQATPEWHASLGKIQDPFSVFIPNILAMYSKPLLIAVVLSIVSILFFWRKSSREEKQSYFFLLCGILLVTLLLTQIGAAYRFLSLYLPFVVPLVVVLFILLWKHLVFGRKIIFPAAVIVFCMWEIWFSIGGIFLEFPHIGVADLDRYLTQEIGRGRSLTLIQSPNQHLNSAIQYYYNKLPKGNAPILIVYDENIVISPKLWLFARRLYYEGIPSMTVGQFNSLISKNGPTYLRSYQVYFIKANENSVTVNTNLFYSQDAKNLEEFLHKELNLSPLKTIYGKQPTVNAGFAQVPMFYVYKILF